MVARIVVQPSLDRPMVTVSCPGQPLLRANAKGGEAAISSRTFTESSVVLWGSRNHKLRRFTLLRPSKFSCAQGNSARSIGGRAASAPPKNGARKRRQKDDPYYCKNGGPDEPRPVRVTLRHGTGPTQPVD